MRAGFALFWHRLGNTPQGLAQVEALAAAGTSPGVHGVELDLKWAADERGRLLLYAHHGPTGRERLSARTARRRAGRGRLLLLDDLLERLARRDLPALIELKRGQGPPEAALAALAARLHAHGRAGRVWIAASSHRLLRLAAGALPRAPRVWFAGPPDARGRVRHRPTTYVRRSLREEGVSLDLAGSCADLLCPLGLRPKPLAEHLRLRRAVEAWGKDYLPGRVVTDAETLASLAAAGLPGAFVYGQPGALAGGRRGSR